MTCIRRSASSYFMRNTNSSLLLVAALMLIVALVTSSPVDKETVPQLRLQKPAEAKLAKEKLEKEKWEDKDKLDEDKEELDEDKEELDEDKEELEEYSWWKLLHVSTLSPTQSISVYESTRTGLRVTLVLEPETPIVEGLFCLVTEAFNHMGLPHTLEHLIFQGSEKYPYKETLDLLANRCLAGRTNAFTALDKTCYTVDTAGKDGFQTIMPVYVEHILFPQLKHAHFVTEVHHINGDGDDAGVVYSEMQAAENNRDNVLYFDLAEKLYPGNSSVAMRTGGMLQPLRDDITNDLIREYHRKYYQPRNLNLIVTGNIEPEEIFQALLEVEEKIESKGNDYYKELDKPFRLTAKTFKEDMVLNTEFPSTDESTGEVNFAWRLPGKLLENVWKIEALKLVGSYLSATSVSPLEEAFVNADPSLATYVSLYTWSYYEPSVSLSFGNVPVEHIDQIADKLDEVLHRIVEVDGAEKFHMERIQTFVKRNVRSRKVELENGASHVARNPLLKTLVYGDNISDMDRFLVEGTDLYAEYFLAKKPHFWINLINDTLINLPRIQQNGIPSKALNTRLEEEEEARLAAQIERLGPEGLAEAEAFVEQAVNAQETPPHSLIESVPLSDSGHLTFRHIDHINRFSKHQSKYFDMNSIPYRLHLDTFETDFVRFTLFFDLKEVAEEDRPYLVLLTESWLETPLIRVNETTGKTEVVPMEDVVMDRTKTVISLYNSLGQKGSTFGPGSYPEQLSFSCYLPSDMYLDGIRLMKEALFNVHFTEDRVRTTLATLINSIPTYKQSAGTVDGLIMKNIVFEPDSIILHSSFLRQKKFLDDLDAQLDEEPKVVLDKLQSLAKQIVRPDKSFVYLGMNVEHLVAKHKQNENFKASDPWANFFDPIDYSTSLAAIDLKQKAKFEAKTEYLRKEFPVRHVIAGVRSDTCYLTQAVNFTLRDWLAPELAAVRVMTQYMSDQLHTAIRGQGLTYSIFMNAFVSKGLLQTRFYKSSQLVEAYKVFREVIEKYLDEESFEAVLIDSAKGAVIHDAAAREQTVEASSASSLSNILRGLDEPDYNENFIKLVSQVDIADVAGVAKKYLTQFLSPEQTFTSVVCGPGDVKETRAQFVELGFDMYDVGDDLQQTFLASGTHDHVQ